MSYLGDQTEWTEYLRARWIQPHSALNWNNAQAHVLMHAVLLRGKGASLAKLNMILSHCGPPGSFGGAIGLTIGSEVRNPQVRGKSADHYLISQPSEIDSDQREL